MSKEQVSNLRKAWISSRVFQAMLDEAQRMHPLETGGSLMGYHGDNGEVVVTEYIGPGPNATHAPYFFMLDFKHEQAETDRLFDENPNLWYIGDWHTHPGMPPTLSPMDIGALYKIARKPDAYCPKPIMIVLGAEIGVVQLEGDTLHHLKLEVFKQATSTEGK